MSDINEHSYAAIIKISLPGQDKTASASVMLYPHDAVETNGHSKLLADCTLIDLQQFAETWEDEVWETYETITLLDLCAEAQIQVQIIREENGRTVIEPVTNWQQTAVVLSPSSASAKEAAEAAFVAEPDEMEIAAPHAKQAEVAAAETADTPAQPLTEDDETVPTITFIAEDIHAITVSEPEPVFEEVVASEESARQAGFTTTITPSQARVRVAGKRLSPGDATWAAVDILMDEPALRAAQAHALSSLNREVAGVLVGPHPEKQPDGRYLVHIIDTIIAKYTVMQGASVTYTAESWRYLNDTLRERYPDETAVMVGWYHTHPGFGIFLSGMDLFIHQNFFTQTWHIAMVLDPRARTSGFFCWNRQKSRVSRHDFAWPFWAPGSW